MKCELCEMKARSQVEYDSYVEWLGHAQWEEFYAKQGNVGMQEYHKEQRLKLERKRNG